MDSQLLYIILEVLGVLIFASEGLFVKDIELHPYINVMLAYAVYAIISFRTNFCYSLWNFGVNIIKFLFSSFIKYSN